jgi:hypothetical protein
MNPITTGKNTGTSVADDLQTRLAKLNLNPQGKSSYVEVSRISAAPVETFANMQLQLRRKMELSMGSMSRTSRRDISSGVDDLTLDGRQDDDEEEEEEEEMDDLNSFDAEPVLASDQDETDEDGETEYLRDETQAGVWKSLKNAARAAKDKVASGYAGYKAAKKASKEEYQRRNDQAKEDEKYRQQKSDEKKERKSREKEEKQRRKEEKKNKSRSDTKGYYGPDSMAMSVAEREMSQRMPTMGAEDDMDRLIWSLSDQALNQKNMANSSSRDVGTSGWPHHTSPKKATATSDLAYLLSDQYMLSTPAYPRNSSNGWPSEEKVPRRLSGRNRPEMQTTTTEDRIRRAFGVRSETNPRHSTMPIVEDEDGGITSQPSSFSDLRKANSQLSQPSYVPVLKQLKTRVDLAALGLSPAFTSLLVNASTPQLRHKHMQGKHWSDAGSQIFHVLMDENRTKTRFDKSDIVYEAVTGRPDYSLCRDDFCNYVASTKMTRINVDNGSQIINVVSFVFDRAVPLSALSQKKVHTLHVDNLFEAPIKFSLPVVNSSDLMYDSAFSMKVGQLQGSFREAMISLKYESQKGGVTGIIVVSHS